MTSPTTPAATELEVCPFCGGAPQLYTAAGTKFKPAVTCGSCNADMVGRTEAEAIAAWNTRARPTPRPAPEGVREGVMDIIEEAIQDAMTQGEYARPDLEMRADGILALLHPHDKQDGGTER